MGLVIVPGRPVATAEDLVRFLEWFGATDGVELGLTLVRDAVRRRDRGDFQFAMVVGFRFGFSDDYRSLLVPLAFEEWHHSHEDIAMVLQDLGSREVVGALVHLAEWVPAYLDFDDARALAGK